MQYQSDKQLEASLDKQEYNEEDLLTIKVPLSLPYMTSQQKFERVDGEIKLSGKIYKYVKRKITDGNLVLLCLPDHHKMQIESSKEEFYKYANDLVQNNDSKKAGHSKLGVFKNVIGEYDNFTAIYTIAGSVASVVYGISACLNYLPSSPHSSPDQPPELA